MGHLYSTSKTTDGIMIFSNGFTDSRLAFSSVGSYNDFNYSQILSRLKIDEDSKLDLKTIKTKFFRENTQIKNSQANINAVASKNIEYYPHQKIYNGMYNGSFNISEQPYENIFNISPYAMLSMNNYRFKYNAPLKHILDLYKGEDKDSPVIPVTSQAKVGPAMFNPLYMISVKGLANNVPLINTPSGGEIEPNLTDCSIKELVRLSEMETSMLGMAKYKYADFMYCKDLGKVSNNHLITLRVFPFPVGDHIQQLSQKKYDSEFYSFSNTGDVGRLVTWFGTDDNKLEDILKYEYNATWKPLNAQIEEIQSKEDDQSRGPLGMLINTFSPQYNKSVEKGIASSQSLWSKIGGSAPAFDGQETLTNYDKNKVYEPKDTVQSTHTYEGKLEFSHEFTLNFSYKLRAYDNINPKSAFLDLLGNILAVTYRRGHFWGGDRKFIGPPQNTSAWSTANKLIDKKFDEVGGIYKGLMDNGINFQDLLGCLSQFSNIGESLISGIKDKIQSAGGIKNAVNNVATELNSKFNFTDALKGRLKSMLGRPALYAMQSLLKGDDVGLWHVTIGNPKNPIVSMGNLIIDKASISHSGPLGIDDFPTEIKVSVTLKHARGRDAVEISKMYAGGVRALYSIPKTEHISQFYGGIGGTMNPGAEQEYLNNVKYVEFDENGNPTKGSSDQIINNGDEKNIQNSMAFEQGQTAAKERIKSSEQIQINAAANIGPKIPEQCNIVTQESNIDASTRIMFGSESFNQISETMIHRVLNEIR